MTRHLAAITLLATLCVGCGDSGAEESPEDDDVESFSTTFPPVTTTSGSASTTAGTATSGDASGTTDPSGEPTTGLDSSGTGPSSGSSTGGGSSGDPLAVYDDEFDDPQTLSGWTLKNEAEGLPAEHSRLDIGETAAGHLTVRPAAGGWFDDYSGFFMFVEIDADFMIETSVNAGSLVSPDAPPTRPFNSGGLLVRSPDNDGPMAENWVTHNLGFQLDEVATEGKSTIDSLSSLNLLPGPHHGVLRVCKVGSQIVLARKLEGDSGFTQTHAYNRPQLVGPTQVGVVASGWNATGSDPDLGLTPDIEARFDYIRFRSITSTGACLDPSAADDSS